MRCHVGLVFVLTVVGAGAAAQTTRPRGSDYSLPVHFPVLEIVLEKPNGWVY